MSGLRFDGVDFAHDGVPALVGVNFAAPAGKLTAIMGPSGCGKSTLIGLAAGLLTPDRGRVSRESDDLAVAFQDPALLPWKTARDNVGFALLAGDLPRALRRERAAEALADVARATELPDEIESRIARAVGTARWA